MAAAIERLRELSLNGQLAGLVWAIRTSGDGLATEVPPAAPVASIDGGWYWLHFNLADARCLTALKSLPGLERPVAGFAVLDADPHIFDKAGLIYGAVPDLQREIAEAKDSTGLLHFLAGEKLLITGRRGALNAPGIVRKKLIDGARVGSATLLLEALFEQIIEGADQYLETISRDVDHIEDRIVTRDESNVRAGLGALRRSAIRLHRHVNGLRLLFQKIGRDAADAEVPDNIARFQKLFLHPCELIDREILTLLERIRSLQDEVAAMLAEETNNHLRVMSILTILFMPPTFVAGLFGMNLKGISFGEHESGFWWGTGVAITASIVVAWFLRRARII